MPTSRYMNMYLVHTKKNPGWEVPSNIQISNKHVFHFLFILMTIFPNIPVLKNLQRKIKKKNIYIYIYMTENEVMKNKVAFLDSV